MNRVYASFGSNVGDKIKNIENAVRLLSEKGLKVVKISDIIITEPYGYKNQPEFLNGALEIETDLNAEEVLEIFLNIEKEMGRVREFKWGPRIIDLDILFFNEEIIDKDNLKIPHPDMQNREFVLKPLSQIAPDFVHPVLKKSIMQLLNELYEKQERKF